MSTAFASLAAVISLANTPCKDLAEQFKGIAGKNMSVETITEPGKDGTSFSMTEDKTLSEGSHSIVFTDSKNVFDSYDGTDQTRVFAKGKCTGGDRQLVILIFLSDKPVRK